MTKNKMMRIASILLVAVLISTCAISGTFAKYVTKTEGTDTARVAKWGILLGVENANVFADHYAKDDETYIGGENTVEIVEDNEGVVKAAAEVFKLVAPGTGVEFDTDDTTESNSIKATVFGTPEVATRYSLKIEGLKDVFLAAGTYTDYTNLVATTDEDGVTTYGYTDVFELDEDYYPVKFDLKVSNENGTSYTLTEKAKEISGKEFSGFSLAEAKAIVENDNYMDLLLPELEAMVAGASNAAVTVEDDAIVISMDFEPNTEMDYTFELIWKWDFEQKDADLQGEDAENYTATYDAADTLLGNLVCADFEYEAAEGADDIAAEDYSVVLGVKLTATAVQID